jgi:hypothetical protein
MHTKPTFLKDFHGDILVRCPRCAACAHLLELRRGEALYNGHRLVCLSCAFERDWVLVRDRSVPFPSGGPSLNGFDLDLWLVTECCGEQLWAFNREHLDFLERHISAKIRPKGWSPKYGLSTSCLECSLPQWMLSRHNRNDVLRGVEKLMNKLDAVK